MFFFKANCTQSNAFNRKQCWYQRHWATCCCIALTRPLGHLYRRYNQRRRHQCTPYCIPLFRRKRRAFSHARCLLLWDYCCFHWCRKCNCRFWVIKCVEARCKGSWSFCVRISFWWCSARRHLPIYIWCFSRQAHCTSQKNTEWRNKYIGGILQERDGRPIFLSLCHLSKFFFASI